jgi:hypothetical protein
VTLRARLRRTLDRANPHTVDVRVSTTLPPVFVGGTGRSGTTVTGRLIGAHPAYHVIPREIRFLTDRGGLCDVVEGTATPRGFEARMRRGGFDSSDHSGPHSVLGDAVIEDALDRLRVEARVDRLAAASAFVHRLLGPLAEAAGASGWVEMTPGNARLAPTLLRLFPDMRLIHSERDGRDVACSVVPLAWGPDDLDKALEWWAESLRQTRAALARLPPGRAHVLRMEALVADDREREYARLLMFLGLAYDPAMRRYFDDHVSAERAHVGRWRTDVPPDRRAAFDAHYQELVAAL